MDSNKTECENIHKSLLEQIKEKDREIKHLEFRHIAIEKQKEFLDCYSKQVIEIEQQLKKVRSTCIKTIINSSSDCNVL